MVKRSLILLFVLLCLFHLAWAEKAILIEQKNGQITRFVFDSEVEMTYNAWNIVITSSEGQTTFDLSTLRKATFQKDATRVEDVPHTQPTFYFKDNTIIVQNAGAGMLMRIFSMEGLCLGTWHTDSQGCLEVDLKHFKERIYIVSMDGITYKIAKS